MSTRQEHLFANRIAAVEGDVIAIDFATANATTVDLADPQLLGTKCAEGHAWEMSFSVACVYKLALPASSTAVDSTTRSTESAAGGAAQGYPMAAGEKVGPFFFRRMFDSNSNDTGLATKISIRGDAATGVMRIRRASQNDG